MDIEISPGARRQRHGVNGGGAGARECLGLRRRNYAGGFGELMEMCVC
jgi:hypothetical protein